MILVCGEALVDLVQVEGSGPAPMLAALPGGSPANAAVALARLGQEVALATRLGEDTCGELVRAHLRQNGVRDDLAVRAAEPTTLALVTLGEAGDASYTFYFDATAGACWQPGDLPADPPAGLAAVHAGSMALAAPAGMAAIGAFLERARPGAVVSLDPNVRPGVITDLDAYRSGLERLVGLAHLVRVSVEDLAALYPGEPSDAAAARWSALGVRLVVVSRGAGGASAHFEGGRRSVPAAEVVVADTVGAGDTFSAALLDSFARRGLLADGLADLDWPEVLAALEFASAAAGITCERQGADPPTAAEVAARLGAGRAPGRHRGPPSGR